MERKKELSSLQRKILEKIINESIEIINYNHPKNQLGEIARNYDETIDALRSLESDFQLIMLDPTIKFGWFDRCGYRVNLEKAKRLYEK